jgi:hypothetical protein
MDHLEESETILCYHDHRDESQFALSLREAPGETRIEKMRAIVSAGSIMEVEGQPVDLFSANFVVQVHDLLRPENQVKLMRGTVLRTIDVAFKTVERARSGSNQ